MKKNNLMEKIQRLFNIDVREVSLVDKTAINEPFTEIKRNNGIGNQQEETVMDEKQVKEAITVALAPLADNLKSVEQRLEAQGKSIDDSKKSADELVSKSEENAKSNVETLKGINEQLEVIAGDTVKRFERIEGLVTKASSQKIAGQGNGEGDPEGKNKPKWPSLTRVH